MSNHFTILGADDVQSRDVGTTDNIAHPPGASSSSDAGDDGQETTNNSSPTYPRVCRNGEQFTTSSVTSSTTTSRAWRRLLIHALS